MKEYLIPKGKHISVREGDRVRAGEPLMDGSANPHDILRVLGVKELAKYLVDEVQEVYRLQGVKINDKHIEVIVRQMLRRVKIKDAGDTKLLIGEQAERYLFDEENDRIISRRAAGHGRAPSSGYHEGVPVHRELHIGGLLPGDHQGPYRGGRGGEDRLPAGPQGERHHGPSCAGGFRFQAVYKDKSARSADRA